MSLTNLITGWRTSSPLAKVGVIAVPLVIVAVLIIGAVGLVGKYKDSKYQKQAAALKEENQRITDSYNQAIGQAKANEQAAREEKAKADAIIATIEARNANVKQLDTKLEQVQKNYEKAKSELGDCADTNDCLKRLCAELRSAGFKTKDCPE